MRTLSTSEDFSIMFRRLLNF